MGVASLGHPKELTKMNSLKNRTLDKKAALSNENDILNCVNGTFTTGRAWYNVKKNFATTGIEVVLLMMIGFTSGVYKTIWDM